MKKVLALVLAFAMMFSTITVAFAEPEVSAEAKALATVGMLAGDGNGVTAEYTAKEMTRFTAAMSLLKLKGLYNDALAFKGDANFADVDAVKWEEGKNILAYLKANPGLGFGGNEKGEFNPNGNINEQSYYKVLLETLGYKQTTAEVAGDFAWEEVLTFAESIGLKPAKAEKFTVDGLAKATVAALKAKMKDGKVLINVLVEAGKVDKAKAVAAELMAEKPEVTAALKSAKAIGNTVVEVEFDAEINEGATDVALYSIEGLEIKSAMLGGTKKVLLETASQSVGKTYTLVVGDVKVNFGGAAKVSGAPELKKATGTDTERVELEFNKVLDTASALDVANYAIKDVKIVSAKLNSARKVVTLTTEGMTAGKSYTVKVTNVKSVDGVALKSASKSFYSRSDKTAPKLEKVEAMTFTRVKVIFNKLVDNEMAQDVANYTIKSGTNELAIEKLVVEDNDDTDKTEVEITTVPQKSGTRYELSVMNIADTSVLANKITRATKMTFTGKAEDKTLPTVSKAEVVSRNMVKVVFNEASRLDWATASDVNNYTFNNDVSVEQAEKLPGGDDDCKTVLLTVSDLGDKSSYKLTIENIADEYGNVIKKVDKSVNYDKNKLAAATISKIYSKSSTEVVIEFNKEVDLLSAKDVANYSLDNDFGTPISAKVSDNLLKITLKTNEQTEGKTYKVTIKGLKDLAGNVLNTSGKFVAKITENDIEPAEIEDAVAVNNKVLRISFSEPIDVEQVGIKAVTNKGTLDYKVAYDDNKVLEFSGATFGDNEVKLTELKNIFDKAGNETVIDPKEPFIFWGSADKPEEIEFSWEQVNVQKYMFTFNEKVTKATLGDTSLKADDSDDNGYDTVWYYTKNVRVGSKAWNDDINKLFVSPHGKLVLPIANLDGKITTIEANLEDKDAPYIVNVTAKDRNKVVVEYNEDLKSAGSYELFYYDNAGKKKNVIKETIAVDGDYPNKVNITTTTALDSRFEYTLKVTGEARDVAGNSSSQKNEEFEFTGTDLVPAGNYITGVYVKNGKEFIVKLNSSLKEDEAAKVKATLKLGTILIPTTVGRDGGNSKNTFVVKLSGDEVLLKANEYTVTLNNFEDKFNGIVEDGITVTKDNNKYTFSYDGAVATDRLEMVFGAIGTNTVTVNSAVYDATFANGEWTKTSPNVLFNVVVKRGTKNVVLYIYEDEVNNQAAADVVKALINAISETDFVAKVKAARKEYNKLTVTQKNLVDNYSTLVESEAAGAFVNDRITNLSNIVDLVSDKAEVAEIKAAYDALSDEEAKKVTSANKAKLDGLVLGLEQVETAAGLLEVKFAAGDDYSNVTKNLTLATEVKDNSVTPAVKLATVDSWVSDNVAVITNAGVVTRPLPADGDAEVTLTAELTSANGKAVVAVEFVLIVKAQ